MLSLQSCSDFLEQEPGTQTSIDELLKNKTGVLQALTGLYSEVDGNVRPEIYAVYADLQGGNIKFTPIATGSLKGQITTPSLIEQAYSFNDVAINSNYKSFYDSSYDIINQANLILEYTPDLTDATIAEKKINMIIVLFNNSGLGLVREIQKNNCLKEFEVNFKTNPDFVKLAEAYGLSAKRVKNDNEFKETFQEALHSERTFLIECMVDPNESTF